MAEKSSATFFSPLHYNTIPTSQYHREEMNNGSIYIHVPFCQSRCAYCSFYSTVCGQAEKEAYIAALCREAGQRSQQASAETTISSVYFGGGTPTCLPAEGIAEIMAVLHRNYQISQDAEITVEANPDDVTPAVVENLRRSGINRISMGVQSFNDEVLKSISRRHTARQAIEAVGIIQDNGISNVSIDLIYGLPTQDVERWAEDLTTAFSLEIKHLSSYALSIEPGTPLYQRKLRGEIEETPEEVFIEMYEMLRQSAEQAGFEQYEISNFSLPGYHSRHNSGYWSGQMYIGLGPSAHSFDGLHTRRWNSDSLTAYIDFWGNTGASNHQQPPYTIENLSDDERYDEIVLTRLRTAQGLELAALPTFRQSYLLRMAEPYLQKNLLTFRDGFLCLTRSGIFISDAIIAELMWG